MRAQNADRSRASVEWPTVWLAIGIFGSWLLLTYFSTALPWWVVAPLGAWLVAWQTSLQHEILHGHPTKWRQLNRWMASFSLILWLPYETYRLTHLLHHRDERLTDPFDDPESYYWSAEQWAALRPWQATMVQAQTTLLGRLLLGPLWIIPRFIGAEIRALKSRSIVARGSWVSHVVPTGLILFWLIYVCKINLAFYVLGIVYPATSLMLLRSFAEHRAADAPKERTAIVENAGILGWLFLYNNLHSVHHEDPTLPWYAIPAWYRANRTRLLQENGGLVYQGYGDVARRYLLHAHDAPLHPMGRVE